MGCAVLMAIPFGALSNAWALMLRRAESVIGAVNMLLLPLTFLSPVFIARSLMPDWMRIASRFNPVNWAVETGRDALQGQVDWPAAAMRVGALAAFGVVSSWLATRAFRSYQRSA
jgi:ABC-2 type transport system permease protein